jgi:hypothetical protein
MRANTSASHARGSISLNQREHDGGLIGSAMSLRRTAKRASGDKPLIERSSAKMASKFETAAKAIGEIVLGWPLRAFEAMSASSNSLRHAWLLSRDLDNRERF